MLSEGPMMISSQPIMRSEGEGPVRGSLIFGSHFDTGAVSSIARTTNLSLSLLNMASAELPSEWIGAEVMPINPIVVRPANEDIVSGYILLSDIFGKPGPVIKMDLPRATYKQGLSSTTYFTAVSSILLLLFGLCVYLLLQKFILARVDRLSKDVTEIGVRGRHSAHVRTSGNDEISSLGAAINEMLAALNQSQEDLKKTANEYRTIFETTGAATVVFGEDMVVIHANHMVETLSGYTKAEIEGRMKWTAFVSEDDLPRMLSYHKQRPSGNVPNKYEFKFVRRDGEVGYGIAHIAIVPGTTIRVASITDVTAMKKAEGILKAYSAHLEELVKEKTRQKEKLMINITHELRTPLVSIVGYLNHVLKDNVESLPEAVKCSLEVVKRNAQRLVALTDDLLDLRSIDSGMLKLDMRKLDLVEVITLCITEIKPFFETRLQKVNVELPPHPLMILGDNIRLCQAFTNILSNASKFTPESGVITVKAIEDGDSIRTEITDTGIGIRREDLERVFEPLAMIEKPTYVRGTGLGLSVTKGLVEAHGGRIWAESAGEGKGAKFVVKLPMLKLDGKET
ncbi:MAG: PAS domain S-box protein [Candidatus Verstraetearchaeota archaeon]|nr:PAS domain S-box protein [Candidatus Verstraetearchaeota archaeon]